METITADFKGQSLKEKLEDNMQFKQNPLRSDLVKNLGTLILRQMRFLNFRRLSRDWRETRPK